MIDREAVRDLLDEELEGIEIPKQPSREAIAEAFCQYVEDEYHDWLKDDAKSFSSRRDSHQETCSTVCNSNRNKSDFLTPGFVVVCAKENPDKS